jgi:rRNA maturation endonuclease Nob1
MKRWPWIVRRWQCLVLYHDFPGPDGRCPRCGKQLYPPSEEPSP